MSAILRSTGFPSISVMDLGGRDEERARVGQKERSDGKRSDIELQLRQHLGDPPKEAHSPTFEKSRALSLPAML